MTLDTRIVIRDPILPRKVFDHCRDLLSCTDAHPWRRELHPGLIRHPYFANEGGQNLPGWLFVYYGPDGPLLRDEHDEGDKASGWPRKPDGYVEVSLDTAYSYRAPNGAGCEDLHAWFVREFGRWLDEQGVKWSWKNEFTGEWFDGDDGLDKFGDADRGALR